MRHTWLLFLGFAVFISVVTPGCSRSSSPPREMQHSAGPLEVLDLNGATINPFPEGATNPTVFVFVSSDCPISNRYAPEIRRLHEEFVPRGLKFWLVYPSPTDSPEIIRRHLKEYEYSCDVIRDPRQVLVNQARVHVTPEAAVFVPGPTLVYHGRIDDRYVDFGKERPAPIYRDLHDVLEAVAAKRPVRNASAPAVGCYISSE